MATVTLKYDARSAIFKNILNIAVLSGATIVSPKENERADVYQKLYGKRKNNKYTENEIFIANAKLNAAKSFEKYL
ncbi:hypothetical protein FACS189440_06110 [Bacteroidia bacterium]|nr:hypothetical protein FACS189440_06110 [Bacteroidia bacterium]